MKSSDTPSLRKFDLEDRLIVFASMVIDIVEKLPNNNIAAKNLGGQLVRSGTSPALNYGEAQGAESKKDFIHKMGVVLKELRETKVNHRIIQLRNWIDDVILEKAIDENSQLIAIISSSIKTAKGNLLIEKKGNAKM
ncbi:MAG: four helix bundle protein [Saprospiraceae bacterium]